MRILMIDPDIAFTLPLKRALENLGDFEIRTVTRLRPAVIAVENALRSTPYNVAVVDTALEHNTAGEVIDALRAVQPDLPVILTSRRTDHADYRTALKTQAFLRKPYPATILASLVRGVAAQGFSFSTAETRVHVPEESLEDVPEPALDEMIEPLLEASQQIAAYMLEEPSIELQDDTIGEVIEAALDEEVSRKIHIITEDVDETQKPKPPTLPESGQEAPSTSPIADILKDTADEESLDTIIQGIRYRSFPQFEPPLVDLNATGKMIVEELPTPAEKEEPSRIPKPEHLPDQYWIDTHGRDVPDFDDSQFVRTTVEEFTEQLKVFETGIEAATKPDSLPEAVLSHYALQLTQFCLESSAQGTLLTRRNEVLGRGGSFDMETWDHLVLVVNDAWKRKGDARTRIIYRRLLNRQVVLFSIKTIDEQILTLIFSTDTPVKTIRQQALRLAESLRAAPPPPPPTLPPGSLLVPDVEESPPVRVVRPAGTYVGYACVWLLDDGTISTQGAQAIDAELRQLCEEQDWDFKNLDVQEDWLAFYVDVPAGFLPSALIDLLMQRSEESLRHAEFPNHTGRLWSDGYLITTPPQDLTDSDIQRFIRFYRREKVPNEH